MFNIAEDVRTVFGKDPAARSVFEVLTCYPGLHAVWIHRIAHALWGMKLLFPARLLSQLGRFLTGIEIHPGARIGRRLFIDHGMGVVIGETTEIGDDVLMYQGVVLGGTSLEKKKRHPTIENEVDIGAGAIILGAIKIGSRSRIGAGSVVLKDVPPDTTVFGVPARAKEGGTSSVSQLEHTRLPDSCSDMMDDMRRELNELKKTVGNLKQQEKLK